MFLRRIRLGLFAAATLFAAGLAMPAAALETVVLSTVMVRTTNASHEQMAYQPITVMIDVADRPRAEYVCSVAPRLHDGIVRALNRTRLIRDAEGKISFDGMEDRLRPPLTEALKTDIIEHLRFKIGAPKVSSSGITRLYEQGCMRAAEDEMLAPATMPETAD